MAYFLIWIGLLAITISLIVGAMAGLGFTETATLRTVIAWLVVYGVITLRMR